MVAGADYDEQAVGDAHTKFKHGNFVRTDQTAP